MSKQTVLIIEDEAPMADALDDKLTRAGFSVSKACNGEEGLALARKEHPDMILLDIIMPKLDGLGVLEQLRKDEWGKNAKVIILTNLNDTKDIEKALEQSVHTYIVKADWKIEDIIKKVEEELG